MKIACILEHNGPDSLLYARDYPGAYSRGKTPEIAAAKMAGELRSYLSWLGQPIPTDLEPEILLDVPSELNIADADSDVLLPGEEKPMTMAEFQTFKALALKSAVDFLTLYQAIPDKSRPLGPDRHSFYGPVPNTAEAMYQHTKNVNSYYFGEIGVDADNDGTIYDCRARGFAALEAIPGFLENPAVEGSYGELWSLRKVLRRFLWHDRIHARALYRRSVAVFGPDAIPDVYSFTHM